MAATIIIDGPEPPEGQKWCIFCARIYKGTFLGLESTQRQLQQLNALSASDVRHLKIQFPPGKRPTLAVAVTTCLVAMAFTYTGGQAVPCPADVCWSHFEGLQIKEGILPATAGDMPMGGAVDLSQRRRG